MDRRAVAVGPASGRASVWLAYAGEGEHAAQFIEQGWAPDNLEATGLLEPSTRRSASAPTGRCWLERMDDRRDRHAAGRIVRRLARRAGIDKVISPHSLRHAAITAALDAVCSLRDVQDFARYADPGQTRRYDRPRCPRPHPTYIVATYLAGATGAR